MRIKRVQTRSAEPGESRGRDLFLEESWRTWRIQGENPSYCENLEKIEKVLENVLLQILIAEDQKLGIHASLASYLDFWDPKIFRGGNNVIASDMAYHFLQMIGQNIWKKYSARSFLLRNSLKLLSLSNNSLNRWNSSENQMYFTSKAFELLRKASSL